MMVLDTRSDNNTVSRTRKDQPNWIDAGLASVRDLNTHASAIVKAVAMNPAPESRVLITRHGKVVAAIVPMSLREAMQQSDRIVQPRPSVEQSCSAIEDGLVSIRALNTHASAIVRTVVATQERVLVTRHGKIVAAIVPMSLRQAMQTGRS